MLYHWVVPVVLGFYFKYTIYSTPSKNPPLWNTTPKSQRSTQESTFKTPNSPNKYSNKSRTPSGQPISNSVKDIRKFFYVEKSSDSALSKPTYSHSKNKQIKTVTKPARFNDSALLPTNSQYLSKESGKTMTITQQSDTGV